MQEEQEYYTIKEAARYLGVSLATIERLVKRGILKKYYRETEARVYYRRAELESARQWKKK